MPIYKDEKEQYYVVFRYRDYQGKLCQKKKSGFTLKRDAATYEKNFRNKLSMSPDITFINLAKCYLEDAKNRLKPTTYYQKTSVYKTSFKILENLKIKDITPLVIRRWQNSVLKQGFATTTQRQLNCQLSALFNFAVKYYGLSKNPVRECGPIGKQNADGLKFWTLDQFNKFMSVAKNTGTTPSRLAFYILFYTGLRLGELLALTPSDFSYSEKKLSITKTFARIKCQDIIMPPKTPKSKREIIIPAFLADMIQEYIPRLPDNHLRLFFMFNKHTLKIKIKRFAPLAGVPIIRVHDLRHSHASLLIELGFSPLLISQRLGHEHIETTLQIYSHLYPNKDNEVASKLDQLNVK